MYGVYEISDYRIRHIIEEAVNTYKTFTEEQKNLDRFFELRDIHQDFDVFKSEIQENIRQYELFQIALNYSYDNIIERIERTDYNILQREIYGIQEEEKELVENEMELYWTLKEVLKIKNLSRVDFASTYSKLCSIKKNENKLISKRVKLIEETKAEYEELLNIYTVDRIKQARKTIQNEKISFSAYIPGRRSKLFNAMISLGEYISQEMDNPDKFFIKNFQSYIEENHTAQWSRNKRLSYYTQDKYLMEDYISKIASGKISIDENQNSGETELETDPDTQ